MVAGDKPLTATLAEKPFEAERRVAGLRVLVAVQAAVAYLAMMDRADRSRLGDAILTLASAYALWMYFAQPFRRWPVLVSGYVAALADGVLIILWLHATGGVRSPFYVMLYLSVFAVAFRYSLREALFASAWYAIGYVLMLLGDGQIGQDVVGSFTRVAYIFFAAMMGGLMASQVFDQARETSRALEREQRSRAESVGSETRARFLAEASKVLASSLDYQVTLKNVAHLLVPGLADACVVDLLEEDGALRRVAEAARSPAEEDVLRELRDYPATDRGPVSVAMRTGSALVVANVDDAALRELAHGRDEGFTRIIRQLDIRTMVSAPLRVHGQSFGAMTLGVLGRTREVSAEEVRMIEEIALRAASAIEHARLYRDAQEAIRTRDEFLSIASHELRTPLNVMMLQTDGLLRQARKEDDVRMLPSFERIKRQVNRLGSLVESLLDVSRVTAGRLVLELGDVDLEAVIAEVTGRLREDAARAGSTIAIQVNGPLVGRWDRMRVDQIVTNLVSNAIKYGAGKPIDVGADLVGDVARLEVIDRGIGIGKEDHARIFERFERAVSSRHYGGFGLGLWIVRQIAEAHGGQISIRSRIGEGSTFVVELPIEGPKVSSSTPPPP